MPLQGLKLARRVVRRAVLRVARLSVVREETEQGGGGCVRVDRVKRRGVELLSLDHERARVDRASGHDRERVAKLALAVARASRVPQVQPEGNAAVGVGLVIPGAQVLVHG